MFVIENVPLYGILTKSFGAYIEGFAPYFLTVDLRHHTFLIKNVPSYIFLTNKDILLIMTS